MANTKIPAELSSTPGIADSSSATSVTIASDGFVQLERTGNEYGLELKSGGVRSGVVLKKPATDTIQGSLLMLADETFRLGTASNYHIQMFQDGGTQIVDTLTMLDGDILVQSGHGISFAATSDGGVTTPSEVFDDYEEGTWTPTMASGGSITTHAATYTKIGRQVTAYMFSTVSPTNDSTQFRVGGLPYNAVSTTNYYGPGSLGYTSDFNGSFLYNPLTHYSQSYLYFHKNNGSATAVYNSEMQKSGGLPIILSVTYDAA